MGRSFSIRVTCVTCAALLTACANSPVPGRPNTVLGGAEDSSLGRVYLPDVIVGIKCEASKGMRSIQTEAQRLKADNNPNYASFVLYPGTVTFSAKVQIVQKNGVKLAAVVPFGTANTVKPSGSLGRNTTGVQSTEITFRVDSYSDPSKPSACEYTEAKGIDTGGFIADALFTLYAGVTQIPALEPRLVGEGAEARLVNVPYDPELRTDSLKLTASFAVEWNGLTGADAKFTFKEIAPSASLSEARTDTHAVTFEFPLRPASAPTETRRIIDCRHIQSRNSTLCLDRLYIERDGPDANDDGLLEELGIAPKSTRERF